MPKISRNLLFFNAITVTALRDSEKDYYLHVVLKHPGRLAYPNKAEIEKRGLKPQGKDWER
jgi:hypothetical protein